MVKKTLLILGALALASASGAAELKNQPEIQTIPDTAVLPIYDATLGLRQLTGAVLKRDLPLPG
jgi:hypothetical protein